MRTHLRDILPPMVRPRHYVNPKDPGVPCFVTATVLDFVHAFRRPEVRDCMTIQLARECKLEKASLYGYVVMPHHIHMLLRPRPDQTISQFMLKFKPRTGKAVCSLLSDAELRQFDQQRGLNGNTFWQRSFRGLLMESEYMSHQKLHYMHMNPVEAGYVRCDVDYRWSSAKLVAKGKMDPEHGLAFEDVVASLRG